ncbi:hypothetical protein Pan216_35910 [Planctomycetes bacterium Pan216]|uniref:Uncharacterized protein n=1 Tax=Kolteria novifilia TaxID=2527975 RepID=A0A518B6Y4_9BACT|nr:hypothetical protein Pan216_35910 [Planctomycetes bacterium Pan216]
MHERRVDLRNWWLWALLALFVLAPSAQAGDRYYLILFGSESDPKRAKHTHTYGTVFRASGDLADPSQCRLEAYTISWMPADLKIKVLRMWPEPGANLGLFETFAWAESNCMSTDFWGPYEIRHRQFCRVIRRLTILEGGTIKYQCIDPLLGIRNNVSDCIHALSDIDATTGRLRYPLILFGKAATNHIAKRVVRNRAQIHRCENKEWLVRRLGLEAMGFRHRHECVTPKKSLSRRQMREIERAPYGVRCWPRPDFIIPAGACHDQRISLSLESSDPGELSITSDLAAKAGVSSTATYEPHVIVDLKVDEAPALEASLPTTN